MRWRRANRFAQGLGGAEEASGTFELMHLRGDARQSPQAVGAAHGVPMLPPEGKPLRNATPDEALEAIGGRPEFGFNYDPSHLLWQMVDPVQFLRHEPFRDRIYHVHVKDAARTLDGKTGLLSSHLDFGDPRRGWDFRSPGRGQVDFSAITRELNTIGYEGPLSVEWEDPGMDREYGAAEAVQFIRRTMMFPAAGREEEGR